MSILFQPANVGSLELKNRLIRSATCEWMAAEDGKATLTLASFYNELAQGGVGLIISGHLYVRADGQTSPGQVGIHEEGFVLPLMSLADAVHREDSKIVGQINHSGRQANPELTGESPLAPSALPTDPEGQPPRELKGAEIIDLVMAYGQAARRVKQASFDGVQLHGAHGFLINQFLSPYTNRRSDNWGGSFENRLNFLGAVSSEVRAQVGPDFPVWIKLGVQDFVEGGLSLSDGLEIVRRLEGLGLDALEISGGISGDRYTSVRKGIKSPEDEAYFLPWAREARKATKLPIILVGGMRSPQVMESVLEEGAADFISMSRPLIRQPDLPKRLQAGESSECISCNKCLKRRDASVRCWVLHPD